MVDFQNEGAERYVKGGFHEVLLGDVLGGKYVVVRKLGFGVYSTVWLANDIRYATRFCRLRKQE
jgi:serine/threonine-protein kinase SRPK3